jgi:putative peptidoglycan lipid II flippase
LRWIAIFGFPAAAALVVLAEPLIATIFFRGAMTAMDVSMSSLALKAYAAGLLGHMAVKILAPGFFARQDMKTPVRIGVIALLSNMVLNLAFIWWLGHIGLALATSASAFINAFLLWKRLREYGIYQPQVGWVMFLAKITTATGVMVFGLVNIAPEIYGWLSAGILEKASWLIGLCIGGAMTYFLVLWSLGFRVADLRIARS